MIKLFIKHTIVEHAINIFFDKVNINFNNKLYLVQGCMLTDEYVNRKIKKVIYAHTVYEVGKPVMYKNKAIDLFRNAPISIILKKKVISPNEMGILVNYRAKVIYPNNFVTSIYIAKDTIIIFDD